MIIEDKNTNSPSHMMLDEKRGSYQPWQYTRARKMFILALYDKMSPNE